jgi:hypothetical protein
MKNKNKIKAISDKINTVKKILFELKKMENGKMTVEEETIYMNFMYDLKDIVLEDV